MTMQKPPGEPGGGILSAGCGYDLGIFALVGRWGHVCMGTWYGSVQIRKRGTDGKVGKKRGRRGKEVK